MRSLAFTLLAGTLLLSTLGCGGTPQKKYARATDDSSEGAKDGGDDGVSARSREASGDEAMMAEVPMANGSKGRKQPAPQSGILTAGSFDDNLYPFSLRSFATKVSQQVGVGSVVRGALSQKPGVGSVASRLRGERVIVTVNDAQNRPVGNARVEVSDAEKQSIVTLTTRSDGRVVLHSSWDRIPMGKEMQLTVIPADGSPSVRDVVPADATSWTVNLPQTQAELPRQLDLALVIDTTGSMGDELRYLKSEIKAISQTIQGRFPDVEQRFSLIVYRDERDEYVTKVFDFTPSLDEMHRKLSGQRASGGGDQPEAMHEAMEKALQLSWRSDETARVLFLFADAPPHTEYVGRTTKAIDQLRENGVAIYPVAASGTDNSTELIMRVSAMLTGSQYLFLTDDSGVGNSHAEPHIPFYHVQRLDHLMTRMISSELSGKRIKPDPTRILRTVGNLSNVNGQ